MGPHSDRGLPPVGVNTFLPKDHCGDIVTEIELIRSTEAEKGQQIANVAGYQALRNTSEGLGYLQKTARDRANVFAALIDAVKSYSLGQISHALYDVGGGVSAEYVIGRVSWLVVGQSPCVCLVFKALTNGGANECDCNGRPGEDGHISWGEPFS